MYAFVTGGYYDSLKDTNVSTLCYILYQKHYLLCVCYNNVIKNLRIFME